MNRNLLKLLSILIIMVPVASAIIQTNISNVTSITYKSDIDQDYGFYRVRVLDSSQSISYVNKTLNISVGDTIIWINDAYPDEPLTIISDQNLWENNSAYLRWNYQKFNYTFKQPGIYTFHVKEYSRLQHQKIIVNATIPIPTYIPTPTPTEKITTIPTPNLTEKIIMTPITPSRTPGFTIFVGIAALLYAIIIRKL